MISEFRETFERVGWQALLRYRGHSEQFSDGLAWVDDRVGFSRLLNDSGNVVLMYHSVGQGDDQFFGDISVDRFRRDLQYLGTEFEFVDLPAVLNVDSDDRKAAITFDDGYENFYTNALPILRKFDAPVTVFVNPVLLGTDNSDLLARRHGISSSEQVMLISEQVHKLVDDDLVTIGNHTKTHANLESESESQIRQEVVEAKNRLEETFGTTIDRFSYPYGSYGPSAVDIVQSSHDIAVADHQCVVDESTNPHLIPRIHAHKSETRMRWELHQASEYLHLPKV